MNDNRTVIIAEAGVNHNGSMEIAKEMVEVAANSGADYVKFQTFNSEDLMIKGATKADYQKKSSFDEESQYSMIKKLELDYHNHFDLKEHCNLNNIKFLSTPFDISSIDLLQRLDLDFYKIPSGEITNLPYLRYISLKGKPIIMSTGMASLEEIKNALNVFEDNGLTKDNIYVLHCNTEYPTPFEDVNLFAMVTIKDELNVKIGYSDHTSGIEVSLAAVAMGASIIEKHFTLDRSLPGPDHAASLEPDELANMVKSIRNIEESLGNGVKKPSMSESKNIPIARKSIVAKKYIKKGERLTKYNITAKRPGTGISPMKWDEVIGRKAKYNFNVDDFIKI